MTRKTSSPGGRRQARARVSRSTHHDPYATRVKGRGALVCDRCEVVYHGGKWFWGKPPLTELRRGLCPACARVHDRYPAGTLRLDRRFLDHRDEVERIVRNVEEAERAEHPLERVMDIVDSDEGIVVTTTGLHLARRITGRLRRRFHRRLKLRYPQEEHLIEVDLD